MQCAVTVSHELFPHHCNSLLFQGSMKTFQVLFSFYALKKISQVHQVCQNYPSLITFSQLWRNSSQLACLFKVKVAKNWLIGNKDPCWLLRWNANLRCLENGQYRLFKKNMFRVQMALYVENNARQSALFLLKVTVRFYFRVSEYKAT